MDLADLERAIAETARAQTSVIAAYLFGSHAAGRAHRESDVDLAVLLDHDALPTASARFDTRLRLGAAFAHALGRNDVELVVLNDVPPHFARAIVLDGRRVFVSDVEADHAFRRNAMLRCSGSRAVPGEEPPPPAGVREEVTFLVERLAELRRHLDHLESLRPRVGDRGALQRDLSLHNDVLFSLLMVAQLVIDIAGELASRRGARFEDYVGAVRALGADERFPTDLVEQLERLPEFRNVLIHEYAELDLDRAVAALNALEPVRRFLAIVAGIESNDIA